MDTPVLKTSTTGFLQRKIWRSTSRRFSTRLELIETEPLVVSAPTPKLVRIGTLGRGPMTPLVSGNSGLTVRLCVQTEMEDMTGGGSEKIRMTHAAAAELERKAIKNGMVPSRI